MCFFILLISLILSIPLYIRYSTRNKVFTQVKNLNEKEFVIVLGAGIKASGIPGSYLRQRLNDVATLYNTKKVRKILLTGDNGIMQHDEISVMNNYLVRNGIPKM